VPRIMFGIVNIHAEESNVPFVRRQPQRGICVFKLLCERRLPRTRKPADEVEGGEGFSFWTYTQSLILNL
jgi:hypothetical protein